MRIHTLHRGRTVAVAAAAATALVPLALASPALASEQTLAPNTHFYTPPPDPDGVRQVGDLTAHRQLTDAYLVGREITTPQAVWFTKGTPQQVQADVHRTVTLAAVTHTVPTLVVYDVPGRDCAQYSAGGAADDAAYRAWADGFARGLIRGQQITVVVEPDGLANLPSDCGGAYTGEANPPTDEGRIADITYAGDAIEKADPSSLVYLDAGHSGWHPVGRISDRLHQAHVEDFQGFSVNVSNYQWTPNLEQYGTWISKCLTYATSVPGGSFGACPDQYWDGGPATNWDGDALDPLQQWGDQPFDGTHASLSHNTIGINSRYDSIMNGAAPTAHFVVDTSRNGQGPWNWRAAGYPDAGTAQDWCNPPGRGLGARPKADPDAAFPLVDAYLWVKTPGQSDGQCDRHGGALGPNQVDPEWNRVDPAAGEWFPQQALQLARLASPPLR